VPNVKNNAATRETRRKLIAAAGPIFAECGVHAATIRAITDKAGVNVAAVNYHFRDKFELYAAVLRRLEEDAAALIPPDEILVGDARQRFCAFVHHLTSAMLGRGQAPWERILMAREFADPSPAMASLLEHVVIPVNRKLGAIVAELTGREADDPLVGLAVASVIAQCVHHLQHREHLGALHPQLTTAPAIEAVARTIADFSLAGIEALAGA
jgi:AcrR family transcriptional regulator